MRKIDIIFAILSGWGVAWLVSSLLKDFGIYIKFLSLILAIGLPILALIGLWISYLIGKKFLFVFQVAKFLLIGVLATLVDLSVFKLLGVIFLGTAFTNLVFKGASFLVATFAKYWGNKFWAFENMEKEGMGKEITQFYVVTAISLGINVGIFSLIVNKIGPQFGTPPATWNTIGILIAAIVVSVWNFLGYKFIVFKK
jgi:putative flippase GtrA